MGCGTAGAIVAKRLSEERNVKVLILEAGNYGNKLLNIPSLGILLQNTNFDWQYTTIPQSTSCLALNNNVNTIQKEMLFFYKFIILDQSLANGKNCRRHWNVK